MQFKEFLHSNIDKHSDIDSLNYSWILILCWHTGKKLDDSWVQCSVYCSGPQCWVQVIMGDVKLFRYVVLRKLIFTCLSWLNSNFIETGHYFRFNYHTIVHIRMKKFFELSQILIWIDFFIISIFSWIVFFTTKFNKMSCFWKHLNYILKLLEHWLIVQKTSKNIKEFIGRTFRW